MVKKDEETVEQEWTNDTPETRRIRVYDVGGDFFLDVPTGCRCTFGYFNPASPGFKTDPYGGRPSDVAKATALRIYADSGDKKQLAVFLNVTGFRDESIKLTKIVQRITVESQLVDDGEGTVEYGAKQARQIRAIPEKSSYDNDEAF